MKHPSGTNSVLLHDASRGKWLLFRDPALVLCARSSSEVADVLREVQRLVDARGLHAAGFVAYEAAPAFDAAFRVVTAPPSVASGGDFPLAWFGLYETPEFVAGPQAPSADGGEGGKEALVWTPSVSRERYEAAIRAVLAYIAAGDTYQVNYTYRLRTLLQGAPQDLMAQLIAAQGAHYGAFVDMPDWAICSASPELFYRQSGRRLVSLPMKGTIGRGPDTAQDREQAARLRRSEKDRAENVMIVDMVRNDMGRIATTGSVRVTRLFDAERYPTLWQMTSTVRCDTTARTPEVFAALFPPASITGAPKVRTMQIVAELEDTPRRIYTGAIGFLAPGRRAQFNVAIRTVLVDKRTGQAEYGVGGGIVSDSTPEGEFEECATKALVLGTGAAPSFDLLETILWKPGRGYALIAPHLARLRRSAKYFDRTVDIAAVRRALEELASRCARQFARTRLGLPPAAHRVRLLVAPDGRPRVEAHNLTPLPKPYRLRLATTAVRSGDPFLYHKTTNRAVYEEAFATRLGCNDVLLWNERGEITESCIANVLVELDGETLTPPVSSGLLAGVRRARLIAEGRAREAVVRVADLPRCTRILLANSVRGVWEATLEKG
jgi:para-aminobenzoate synthetase/4-amino-4-deoxychorismate lyase